MVSGGHHAILPEDLDEAHPHPAIITHAHHADHHPAGLPAQCHRIRDILNALVPPTYTHLRSVDMIPIRTGLVDHVEMYGTYFNRAS